MELAAFGREVFSPLGGFLRDSDGSAMFTMILDMHLVAKSDGLKANLQICIFFLDNILTLKCIFLSAM